jgi:lysine-specific demethylase/histidyl-hydroxylase NO66
MSVGKAARAAAIERLIAPVSPGLFMAEHWERRPLHVARPVPSWCAGLPAVADIDALVRNAAPSDVRFVRTERGAGKEMEVPATDDRADLYAAYRAYGDGWTIVINAVHGTSAVVGRLAADLEEAVAHKVGVNLYFTPPDAQGFAPHCDGHDVFVLQVAGEKHWRVYQWSVVLPLEEQEVPIDRERLGPPLIDATLAPGHVLYIPRGFIHAGVAGGAASAHLTIGMHPIRWADLVREVVGVAAERDVGLRRSLPSRGDSPAPRNADLRDRLSVLLAATTDASIVREAFGRLKRRRVHGTLPVLGGHFAAIDDARSVGMRTVVMRRPGIVCSVRVEKDRAVLEFGANRVDGPAAIEPALRFITRNERFTAAGLPDILTNSSKLVLARRLVTEGVLSVERASASKGEMSWPKRRRKSRRRKRS